MSGDRVVHEAVSTPDVAEPAGLYSHAFRVGPWLFVSGQLPLDTERRIVGTTPSAHVTQALEIDCAQCCRRDPPFAGREARHSS
jgi:enamine deaminase RidA (YjgF/YER057c/UK114 family)